MSFVVNKSKNIRTDEATSNAIAAVLERLEEQATSVKSVSILANFSIDSDTALAVDAPLITQGLVVCVSPDYLLSEKDMSWFHPSIGRGRSLFSLDAPVTKQSLKQVALTNLASSVGTFSITRPDEFGSEEISQHLIVDTAPNMEKLYQSWLVQGATAGEVATQWKRTTFNNVKSVSGHSANYRTSLVSAIATETTHEDTVNDVLTDNVNVYFTNNCVKRSSEMLMKCSALGGYRLYTAEESSVRFYPASWGTNTTFYKWDDMKENNVSRIASCCSWDDALTFNTQVMRPPSLRQGAVRNMEEEYGLSPQDNLVMRFAHFTGSSAIVDKMNPNDVLQLTPSTDSTFISAPIDPAHPVFAHLVNNLVSVQEQFPSFQLLNPKYVSGNRLQLPREVYQIIV